MAVNPTYTIDLPFNLSEAGKVKILQDTEAKVWKNKILSLLSTGVSERVWYYNYGIGLNNTLFEQSNVAADDARAAIEQLFGTWLPELTLVESVVGFDSSEATLTLNIIYKLPSGDMDSVNINTASLTAAGEIIEVMK